MPRSVAGAQPSNQHARDGEPGYIAPEAEVTVTDAENATIQEADSPPVPDEIAAARPAAKGRKST